MLWKARTRKPVARESGSESFELVMSAFAHFTPPSSISQDGSTALEIGRECKQYGSTVAIYNKNRNFAEGAAASYRDNYRL